MKKQSVKNLVLGALFLALALLLPFVTGQIPQIGQMLCPMHLPVLLAGFVCGGPIGAAVGFIAPLLRCLIFSMPPLMNAIPMAFELLTYGLVSGLLYGLAFRKKNLGTLYASLLIAMVAGRVVWGVVMALLLGVSGGAFTWSAFVAGAFAGAVPGIILHIVLIPVIVFALQRAGLAKRAG